MAREELTPQQQALLLQKKKKITEFNKLEYNAWLVQSAETHKPIGVFKYKSDALKAIKGYLRTLNFILLHGDIINELGKKQKAKYLDEIIVYREELSNSENSDFDFDTNVTQTLVQLHITIPDAIITTSKYKFPIFKDGFKLVRLGSNDKDILNKTKMIYHLEDNKESLSENERNWNNFNDNESKIMNLGPLFKVYDQKDSKVISF